MKKHTILWADDDPDDLMLIREVLKINNHSHDVVEVTNGKEVLKYLQEAKGNQGFPCLIILDMNMPILSGKDTLTILKNDPTFQSIPVVMFTTSNSELDRMFCKKYNVEMITKPPEYNALEVAVNKILHMCNLS